MLRDVLINLVRERHAINDSSDPMQQDWDARAAFWKDIANEMNYKGESSIFIYLAQ